jgi:hypothetical protein
VRRKKLMRSKKIKRLDVPRSLDISYGGKHIKIFAEGRLVMVLSKGTRRLDGPWMRAARKRLLDADAP